MRRSGAEEPRGHECREDEENGDGERVVEAVGRIQEQVGAGLSQGPLSGSGHRPAMTTSDDDQERDEAPGAAASSSRPAPGPEPCGCRPCRRRAGPGSGPRGVRRTAGIPDVEDDACRLAGPRMRAPGFAESLTGSASPGSGWSPSTPVKSLGQLAPAGRHAAQRCLRLHQGIPDQVAEVARPTPGRPRRPCRLAGTATPAVPSAPRRSGRGSRPAR